MEPYVADAGVVHENVEEFELRERCGDGLGLVTSR